MGLDFHDKAEKERIEKLKKAAEADIKNKLEEEAQKMAKLQSLVNQAKAPKITEQIDNDDNDLSNEDYEPSEIEPDDDSYDNDDIDEQEDDIDDSQDSNENNDDNKKEKDDDKEKDDNKEEKDDTDDNKDEKSDDSGDAKDNENADKSSNDSGNNSNANDNNLEGQRETGKDPSKQMSEGSNPSGSSPAEPATASPNATTAAGSEATGATATGSEAAAATGEAAAATGETAAAAGNTAAVATEAGAAAGEAGAAAGGTAAAPIIGTVLLVILIILLVIFLVSCAVYLMNSDVFTQFENFSKEGEDEIEFTLEETTVAMIIDSRQQEYKKPLLRFSVEPTKILFFFTIANSEFKDLIYDNLSKSYDAIVDEVKSQKMSEIEGNMSSTSIVYTKDDEGNYVSRFRVNDADGMLTKYGTSGFSIKNYMLYLADDEFTNGFLSDTLASRSIEEVYASVVNSEQGADRGDSALKSITDEFKDYLKYTSSVKLLEGFDNEEDIKKLIEQYEDEYKNFLTIDLSFSLIYKYLFCSVDNFNSIIWNVYKGHKDYSGNQDGTVEIDKANSELKNFKGENGKNKQVDSILVPKVIAMDLNASPQKEDTKIYEKNINTVINMVNPYLMHWVVPYSLNVATGDYTYALDVMYNMRCPIRVDVFEVESKTKITRAYLYMNIDKQVYQETMKCLYCGSYVASNNWNSHASYHYKYDKVTAGYNYLSGRADYVRHGIRKSSGQETVVTEKYKPKCPDEGITSSSWGSTEVMFYDKVGDYVKDDNGDYKIKVIGRPEEIKNVQVVPKLRYAEGMFSVTKAEYVLVPYKETEPTERTDDINDDEGILTRTELFQDQLAMKENGEIYTKTYKVSYLEEDDYDSEGARATGEKINRVEWFIDYGIGDNEMFPDKTSEDWYKNYAYTDPETEDYWDTFKQYYHVSFVEVNKVAEKNNMEQIPDENKPENYLKYIEYKYVKNPNKLWDKINELKTSDQKITVNPSEVQDAFSLGSNNIVEKQEDFEIDDTVTYLALQDTTNTNFNSNNGNIDTVAEFLHTWENNFIYDYTTGSTKYDKVTSKYITEDRTILCML